MPVVWRKLVRRYHLWCAPEDVRRSGLQTPAGVWFCDRCRSVALSEALVCGHLASPHQVA
jgi:hypothetical protein